MCWEPSTEYDVLSGNKHCVLRNLTHEVRPFIAVVLESGRAQTTAVNDGAVRSVIGSMTGSVTAAHECVGPEKPPPLGMAVGHISSSSSAGSLNGIVVSDVAPIT